MEQFTFSFEDLIRFFRMQQRRDYEGIDAIISLYDTTSLRGIRRQYSITAVLMELGLNPIQDEDDKDNRPELELPESREEKTFSIEGSYQIIVCELLNHYIAFNVFLN